MLPIGGHYTMGPREAALAVELLGVKHVMPIHYGTFPILAGTPEQLRTALDERGLNGVRVHATGAGGHRLLTTPQVLCQAIGDRRGGAGSRYEDLGRAGEGKAAGSAERRPGGKRPRSLVSYRDRRGPSGRRRRPPARPTRSTRAGPGTGRRASPPRAGPRRNRSARPRRGAGAPATSGSRVARSRGRRRPSCRPTASSAARVPGWRARTTGRSAARPRAGSRPGARSPRAPVLGAMDRREQVAAGRQREHRRATVHVGQGRRVADLAARRARPGPASGRRPARRRR